MATVTVERQLGSERLILETGRLAKQAHGAVTVRYGDTVVLATVLSAPSTRDIDFFPLYVDYREMHYAGGKFPGGFFKREGRPSTKEILSARMIDRTLRPLFPDDFSDEVQIQCIVVAADKNYDADVLSVIGGSASVVLSHAPLLITPGAVRVGRVNGQLVLFPTYPQRAEGDFDLVAAGNRQAIHMIEFGGKEVPEQQVAEACEFALKQLATIIDMIEELASKAGKPKEYQPKPLSAELLRLVTEKAADGIRRVKTIPGKTERNKAVEDLRDQLVAELCPPQAEAPPFAPEDVRQAFFKVEGKVQRQLILSGVRPDGRALDEVRPITIDVPALPRVHGSAVFTRGETQSLATVTLGTPRDQQKIDGLQEEYFKRFIMHYNFPPFSVAEIRPVRGPSRRDIGHGALAEKSLEAVLPDEESFVYTVRVVSEILESNGSSSMASVCSGSLALMDAGVPIRNPVAGVSIGMVCEGDRKVLLTDILGEEDFHGDMDFKVAGTKQGITGIQMDFKPASGVDLPTIGLALQQARQARMKILAEMAKVIEGPRPDISPNAPRILTLKIDPEKIGKLIGPGGKTINALSTKYDVTIDVEDDGTVFVASESAEGAKKALAEIETLTMEIKVGQVFTGKVVSIKDFGAFVELVPGQDGLVHVSELDEKFVKNVQDVVKIGDEVQVKVIAVDDQGRVKLSRKALLREQHNKSKS